MSPDRFFNRIGEGGIISLASSMVHEACHVYRYQSGVKSGGYEGEKACLQVQIEATATFDDGGGLVAGLRHVLENIDNPEYQWWNK